MPHCLYIRLRRFSQKKTSQCSEPRGRSTYRTQDHVHTQNTAKVIVGHLAQVDLEALGSLISSIEWQLLDENYNRDSAHILFKFQIHIYSANAMQAGGGWIPLPERIAGTKVVINPHNEDDNCFIYAEQLGLVDISLDLIVDKLQFCRGWSESKVCSSTAA